MPNARVLVWWVPDDSQLRRNAADWAESWINGNRTYVLAELRSLRGDQAALAVLWMTQHCDVDGEDLASALEKRAF